MIVPGWTKWTDNPLLWENRLPRCGEFFLLADGSRCYICRWHYSFARDRWQTKSGRIDPKERLQQDWGHGHLPFAA